MGGVSLNQPLINDDPLPLPLPGSIAKGDQIEGLLSAGWTNERHSSYISSMEASFVEQLYGQENCNYDANKNNLRNIVINSFPENPWVRRFKPRGACVNHRGIGMEPIVDDYGSGTDTVREKVRTHAGVAKTSVIIGKSKEVTDQNFPDDGIQSSNDPCKKQKSISGPASNDQDT
ncbi:cold-regulated protein 27-like isoform X2 [Miscanthus floridulus]|uniref:cold-regulated protein 27-like isoform X2 n=1 Tax=Miscanthus floridulus TaxID=154761 RepID=UPI00345889A7